MKKIFLTTALAIFGMAGSVSADLITDTTYFDADGATDSTDLLSYGGDFVNKLEGSWDWITWEHIFTFDPAAETINSANLSLALRDDKDCRYEFALGFTDGGDWGVGEVDTNTYDFNIGVASLVDGSLRVTLLSLYGDFYIDKSELTIDYNPVSAPVPEPSTMLLFGAGVLGVIGYNRRRYNTTV